MKKILKEVVSFRHSGFPNFKLAPFEVWKRLGGGVAMGSWKDIIKCVNVK